MRLSIYQIRLDADVLRLAFQDLDSIYQACHGQIPAEIYDLVYTGDVEAQTLEDVFAIFNLKRPEEYHGRSMTQSDVVEVHEPDGRSLFYFCDIHCFTPIHFERDKIQSNRL